ncbi:MAG: hypothetical protein JWN90_167, partial [Parcubacteria group bacterium]|nr:hypothetical protein [Parcubacteria group bacterium]
MEGPRHGVPNNKPEKRVFNATLVDVSNLAEAQARDTADHRMTESKEDRSKGFFRRLRDRVWKHNIAQEYYRQKEMQKARKEIKESGNLYAAEGEDESKGTADHARAMEAVVERFTSEYEQDTLRDDERESKVQMENGPTNEKIKDLIRSYAADPTMTPAAFTEERNRILSSLDESYAKEGAMYADNLLSIAT